MRVRILRLEIYLKKIVDELFYKKCLKLSKSEFMCQRDTCRETSYPILEKFQIFRISLSLV
ncbi:hypothetical protein V1477_009635 [Vespula maculifrons]|uniref:Uncharacterized protein n=1 Tax=Vespula maculifrons TaxID=7453 RepID=A0ABD2CAC7_VESMC